MDDSLITWDYINLVANVFTKLLAIYIFWRCLGYLSDRHGAQDIQENEGAVSEILSQQVTVRQALDVGQRHKRQLGYDSTVEAEENTTKRKDIRARKWNEEPPRLYLFFLYHARTVFLNLLEYHQLFGYELKI